MERILFTALLLLLPNVILAYDNGDVPVNTLESARRMILNLIDTFGDKYPKGAESKASRHRSVSSQSSVNGSRPSRDSGEFPFAASWTARIAFRAA